MLKKRIIFVILIFVLGANVFCQNQIDVYEQLSKAQKEFFKDKKTSFDSIEKILLQKNVPQNILIECAKVFLKDKRYYNSLCVLQREEFLNIEEELLTDFNYLMAISLMAYGKEEDSKIYFEQVCKTQNDYVGYSLYFLGIINYRQEKYKKAFEYFNQSEKTLYNVNYRQSAIYYCAICAMQEYYFSNDLSWLNEGIKKAEEAIVAAHTENQKISSIKMLSEMYIEKKDFDKCEQLLLPYSRIGNPLGKMALFQLSIMYEKRGEIQKAADSWQLYTVRFEYEKDIDEAYFRYGELMYNFENYKKCIEVFDKYKTNYPQSKYLQIAYFYLCDALYKENEKNRSLLLSIDYLNKYKDAPYGFQLMLNCAKIYAEKEDYKNALSYVQQMINKYPEQIDAFNLRVLEKKYSKIVYE